MGRANRSPISRPQPLSLVPWILLDSRSFLSSPLHPPPHPPTWNLTRLPSTVRRIPPGDRFIDTSAKQNTSNSQRRQETHWHGDKIEVPFISAGLPVKCSSYTSLKQLDCVPQLKITPPPLAAFWFHNHNGVSSMMFCYFPHLDI